MATFADDTAIISSHANPIIASHRLQVNIRKIQEWLNIWRIKVNESKTQHITFTLNKRTCPTIYLQDKPIQQVDEVKYLELHLDKRLV